MGQIAIRYSARPNTTSGHVHWHRLVKNIGGGNQSIWGEKKVAITDESIGISQLLTLDTYRNRNLGISKVLLKSQAHQGTSLFASAASNQRACPK